MSTETKKPILIDIPMPIETPRLIIRPAQEGDGAAMFAAKEKSFTELNKWMPWAKEIGTAEDSETTARDAFAKFLKREDIMLLGFSKESGEMVISTGLHRMDWENRIFEIGFWVCTPESGKGYATESTNALIRYAFNALSARKVTICHAEGNNASRRVIEKLGFIKDRIEPEGEPLPDGSTPDRHWYTRVDTNGLPDMTLRW